MSVSSSPEAQPSALKASIRAVEIRLGHRRDNVGIASTRLVESLRDRLIAPPTLVAAGLIGVALDRSQRPGRLRLLAIVQAASVGLRRVLSATARTNAGPH